MLPDDYPEDFAHSGLDETWFRGIPYRIQRRAETVNSRLRVIRNPLTQVFVIVLKLNPEDPCQVYPFFGVRNLVGWAPILETLPGQPARDGKPAVPAQPVEAVERLCEGMEKSRAYFERHYGETKEQIGAAVASDQERVEVERVRGMRESSAFARQFGTRFMAGTQFGNSNSFSLRSGLFRDSRREFVAEAERLRRLRDERLARLVREELAR